jgi:hypothetical protein
VFLYFYCIIREASIGKKSGEGQKQEEGTDAVMEAKDMVEPGKTGGEIHEGR